MRCKRTVRRPTRWTPDEWRRVEAAADARNVPPARFVREAVLAAVEDGAPARPRFMRLRRRVRDELVHQLGRVLNNLRQVERIADEDGDEIALVAASLARITEHAIRKAPSRDGDAAPLVEQLIVAGRALNEIAHRANADEELPPGAEVTEAIQTVHAVVRRVFA